MLGELKYMIKRKVGDLLQRFERYSEDSYIEAIGQTLNSAPAEDERLDLRIRIAFMCCMTELEQRVPQDMGSSWTYTWKRSERFLVFLPPDAEVAPEYGQIEHGENGDVFLVKECIFNLCVCKPGKFKKDIAVLSRTPTTHGCPWDETVSSVHGDVSTEWLYRAFRYASGLDSKWVEPC